MTYLFTVGEDSKCSDVTRRCISFMFCDGEAKFATHHRWFKSCHICSIWKCGKKHVFDGEEGMDFLSRCFQNGGVFAGYVSRVCGSAGSLLEVVAKLKNRTDWLCVCVCE